VTVEVRLLTEAAFAEGALEGAFLVVNVAHVTLEVGRDAEASSTVLAFVRLQPESTTTTFRVLELRLKSTKVVMQFNTKLCSYVRTC